MAEAQDVQEGQQAADNKSSQSEEAANVEAPLSERHSSFFEFLAKTVERSLVEQHLVVTPYGLFVAEQWLEELLRHYGEFFSLETDGKKIALTKAVDNLFGSNTPGLSYILKGKQVLPGFLIEQKLVAPQRFSIPLYKGRPMDARDYLHPRDPLFHETERFSSTLGPHGFQILCKTPDATYLLSEAQLRELALVFRKDNDILKQYPSMRQSLRAVLQNLPLILKDLKPFARRRRALIPQNIAGTPCTFLVAAHGLCLVVARDSEERKIEGFIQTSGRARKDLFFQEFPEVFQILRKDLKTLGIYIPKKRGPFLFNLTVEGNVFKVPAGVFLAFLDDLIYAKSMARKIPRFFTAADAVKLCAEIFKDAVRVEVDVLHEVFRNTATKDARWYRRDGWVFQLSPAGVFLSMTYEPGVEQKPARYRKLLQAVKGRSNTSRPGGAKHRSGNQKTRAKHDKKKETKEVTLEA